MPNDARNHGNIEKWLSSSSIWRAGPGQEAREKPLLVFLSISSSSCVNKNNALGPAPDSVPDAGSRRSIYAVVIAVRKRVSFICEEGERARGGNGDGSGSYWIFEIINAAKITKLSIVNSRCNKIKWKISQFHNLSSKAFFICNKRKSYDIRY